MSMQIRIVPLLVAALVMAACGRSPASRGDQGPTPPAVAPPAPVAAAPDTTSALVPLPTPDEQARGIAALRQGQALASAGDTRGAERVFAEAARVMPAFHGWAYVLAARAAAGAGDTASVRRVLEGVGDPTAREQGWRVRADALRRAGDTAAAAEVAEGAAPSVPSRSGQAASWAAAGEARRATGDLAGATADLRRAMQAAPASPGGVAAARVAAELPGLAPEDRLLAGRTLLRNGGTERGVAGVEAYLASGRGTPEERAALRLEAGRALFAARRYAAAAEHLRAAAPFSGEAAVLAGRTARRQGNDAAARALWEDAARRFPREPWAAEALAALGDLERETGNAAAARERYRAAVATGIHSQAASDAALRLAGMSLLAGDAPTALRDLDAFTAGRPRDALTAPALYWAGRARLRTGEKEAAERSFREARDADPVSFYGVRATERLGIPLNGVPLAPAPTLAPRAEAEVRAAMFRADVLRELGLGDEAWWEMDRIRERMADDPVALYAVAEGMAQRGRPIAAVVLGQEIQQRRGAWDPRLLRIVFPYRFRELVEREARRNGLDPFLVAGLIRRESIFDPNAVSAAGAVGLMQVMPETGAGLAQGAGIAGFRSSMLKDPAVNLRLGTRFLAAQVRRYPTLTEVFAAYNAGPGRVARWRSFPEYGDEDLFVERIPFEETRTYVKKVRVNVHVYEMLYGGRSAD
ncbi:MAG: transglycosylase SLT domain-containing protein [Gemmatimonadetes bacterium]|nr:transglycosylase SLT domain-containing protein [Gemmatimonadota bacterium]